MNCVPCSKSQTVFHEVHEAFESPSALANKKLGSPALRRSPSPSRFVRKANKIVDKDQAEFFRSLRDANVVSLSSQQRKKKPADFALDKGGKSSRKKAIAGALSLIATHHKGSSRFASSAMMGETKEEFKEATSAASVAENENQPDAFDLAVQTFSWEAPAGPGNQNEMEENEEDSGRMWELASAMARGRSQRSPSVAQEAASEEKAEMTKEDSFTCTAGDLPYPFQRGLPTCFKDQRQPRSELTIKISNTSPRSYSNHHQNTLFCSGGF